MASQERNPLWADSYPTVNPDFTRLEMSESPYGKPNNETLRSFTHLLEGSVILDVGGGDGRYGLPLAQMGHTVIIMDVDVPHLTQIKKKRALIAPDGGDMYPIQADALQQFPFAENTYDAVLNAGFGYLLPPEELDTMFEHMTQVLKPGGLFVMEFATNRERRLFAGGPSLLGKNEHKYSHKEAGALIDRLFAKHNLVKGDVAEKEIHFEEPYFLHNDLVIVAGYKGDVRKTIS